MTTTLSASRQNKKKRRRIALGVILLLALLAVFGIWLLHYIKGHKRDLPESVNSEENFDFSVVCLDVGQGNCSIVRIDDEVMIIDAGDMNARDEVREYLARQEITKIKYAVATHNHFDHIGGMAAVLSKTEVDTLMISSAKNDIASYHNMMDAAAIAGTKVMVPQPGSIFPLGSGRVIILGPVKDYPENLNDTSLVILVEYEDKRVLFMGDAGKEAEADMLAEIKKAESVFRTKAEDSVFIKGNKEFLEQNVEYTADVIVLGHHGSSDSTSEELIKKFKPREAVISCGRDNDYGHPHRETLELLEKNGIRVRRTDLEGNIRFGANSGYELCSIVNR